MNKYLAFYHCEGCGKEFFKEFETSTPLNLVMIIGNRDQLITPVAQQVPHECIEIGGVQNSRGIGRMTSIKQVAGEKGPYVPEQPARVASPEEHLRKKAQEFSELVNRCLSSSSAEVRGAAKIASSMLFHHSQSPFRDAEVLFGYMGAELEELREAMEAIEAPATAQQGE